MRRVLSLRKLLTHAAKFAQKHHLADPKRDNSA
jgi:hypothetical protein